MLLHWILLSLAVSAESDIYTVFSFSRKINTCDPLDRPLEETTSKIIWAYNDNDPNPETGAVPKHSNKGSQSVRFFSQGEVPPPSDAVPVDITVGGNTLITFDNPAHPSGANYWCSAHKITNPIFNTKQQLVRFEPIVDPRYVKQVHHIVIYLCKTFTDEELKFSQSCYDGNMPDSIASCLGGELLAIWAVGGEAFDFPSTAGVPFGPIDSLSVLLEIHYENQDMITMYDNSGFKFWFTSNLRQYDAGMGLYAHVVTPQFVIPKGQASYTYEAWVPSECTNLLPADGIELLAVNLHTHVIGTAVRLQQFRDGVELQPILEEPYYDFNFQDYTKYVNRSVRVLPGDSVRLTCTYNSMYRNYDTPMGLSTAEEMCVAYFLYYPKSDYVRSSYGDYSFDPSIGVGKVSYCGYDAFFPNLTLPTISKPYQPPPCPYVAPDPSKTTPTLRTALVDPSTYQRSTFLDPDNKIKLYWTIDRQNMVFHGALEGRTPGWVGFGISAFGMEGADVTIGWVDDNNQVFFADRFATRKAEPPIDPLQDYYDISGGQISASSEDSTPLLTRTQLYVVGAVSGALIVLIVGGGCYCYQQRKRAPFAKLVDDDSSIPM